MGYKDTVRVEGQQVDEFTFSFCIKRTNNKGIQKSETTRYVVSESWGRLEGLKRNNFALNYAYGVVENNVVRC